MEPKPEATDSTLLRRVTSRAVFQDEGSAQRAIAGVLETLGEALTVEEAHALAEELLAEFAHRLRGKGPAVRLPLDAFYGRVAEKLAIPAGRAVETTGIGRAKHFVWRRGNGHRFHGLRPMPERPGLT